MSDDGEAIVARHRQVARALQLALRSDATAVARAAAVRVAALPRFAAVPLADLCTGRVAVDRRAVHDVVALEAGFAGWAHLLQDLLPELDRVTMHVSAMGAWLSRWFVDHAAAAASLAAEGGVLLPYRSQFFVAPRGAVVELGLDPHDPDWRRIGWDWVRPLDPEARLRLARQRWSAMLARGDELP